MTAANSTPAAPSARPRSDLLGPYLTAYAPAKVPARYGPLDADGVPMALPRPFRLRGAAFYHPTVVFQYALAHHDLWLEGAPSSRDAFLRCAAWAERAAAPWAAGRFLAWPLPIPLRTPPVRPPWISGLTQGQGLSVLARSFRLTGSADTERVARGVARSFLADVSQGGVLCRLDGGGAFIEEVAAAPPIHILNGCLYALFGLHEHVATFADPDVEAAFRDCIDGVERLLPSFDTGAWSRYSLGVRWNLADAYYHPTHVRQLRRLGANFGRPAWVETADRWERYGASAANRSRQAMKRFVQTQFNRALSVAGLGAWKLTTGSAGAR